MSRIAPLLALFALTACGQQEAKTYRPEQELTYMRACLAAYRERLPAGMENEAGANQVCTCSWERITREIPVEEFEAFERLPPNEQTANALYDEIRQYAAECTSQDTPPTEDPPPP